MNKGGREWYTVVSCSMLDFSCGELWVFALAGCCRLLLCLQSYFFQYTFHSSLVVLIFIFCKGLLRGSKVSAWRHLVLLGVMCCFKVTEKMSYLNFYFLQICANTLSYIHKDPSQNTWMTLNFKNSWKYL